MQVAIDSFDLEIVKSIIEKGLDINKLVIDADEISPLYYAINRKEAIKLGFSNFMKKLEDNPFNITWKNFYSLVNSFNLNFFRTRYRCCFDVLNNSTCNTICLKNKL